MRQINCGSYTVLTDAGLDRVEPWLQEFDTFRQVVQGLMEIKDEQLLRLNIVLLSRPEDLRELVPQQSLVLGDILVLTAGLGQQPMIATSLDRRNANTQVRLRTAAVMWLLSSGGTNFDPWVMQGCIDFFGNLQLKQSEVTITRALTKHLEKLDPQRRGVGVAVLNPERLPTEPAFGWAAMHYLLVQRDGWKGTRSLISYQRAVDGGVERREAFAAAFGMSIEEANAAITQFLERRDVNQARIGVVPPAGEKPVALQDLPLGVRDCLLAQFMIQQIGADRAKVMARIERAAAQMPDSLLLLETLWVFHTKTMDYGQAREVLTRAMRAGTTNHFLRRQWCLDIINDDMLAKRTFLCQEATAISAADTLLDLLRANPYATGNYKLLAQIVPSITRPRSEDRKALENGRAILPENDLIGLGLAAWDWRNGDLTAARNKLGDIILTDETGPVAQAFHGWLAQQLLATEVVNRVRAALAAGDYAEVESRLAALTTYRLDNPQLQAELDLQRLELSHSQLVDRVEKAVHAGRLDSAELLLESFARDVQSELLRRRIGAAQLKLAEAKSAAQAPH
ncbi:MAG: hypothetical protein KF897_14475 [Opitutaceae bacterium]|nr:hypothetical protein [Opitutaceae bacterium]